MMKYKISGRYAMGWTDPRGIFGNSDNALDGLKIGNYYLNDLSNPSDEVMDIFHKGYICRARKEEFATFIEAFLQEKKDERQRKNTTDHCGTAPCDTCNE